jgi:ankyrin repeat protein
MNRAMNLIESGADLNARACKEWDETTALIEAIVYDEREIVEKLIHKGADPNLSDIASSSPLMTGYCRTEIVPELIVRGAK